MWMNHLITSVLTISVVRLSRSEDLITYILNTRQHPTTRSQLLYTNNPSSVENSSFDPNFPTVIFIHGWKKLNPKYVFPIRDAYLSQGEYNFITVNWTLISEYGDRDKIPEFIPFTGKKIAEFVDFMAKMDYIKPEKNLFVAGHSVGAQVAGHVGKNVKSGKIHTIYGLDPSNYYFPYEYSDKRINSTDADYVETIHVSRTGYEKPIGKAVFYANGGKVQPNCKTDENYCSHLQAIFIFSKAVSANGIPSIRCSDYKAARAKNCGSEFSKTVRMGALSNYYEAEGVYYIPATKYRNVTGMTSDEKKIIDWF